MHTKLYRISGDTWSCQIPKEPDLDKLEELIEKSKSSGTVDRPDKDYWEVHLQAGDYGTAATAAKVMAARVHQIGMQHLDKVGTDFALVAEGLTSLHVSITPVKATWKVWALSFIPFFRKMGNPSLRRFKISKSHLHDREHQRSWRDYLFSWIRSDVVGRQALKSLHRERMDPLMPVIEPLGVEICSQLEERVQMEPFADAWTRASTQIFQERTRYFDPQKGLKSDYRLVIRGGSVEALPISPDDDPEENRATVQAYCDFIFSEYETLLEDGHSFLEGLQWEYKFNLQEMLQQGFPLTPEHIYRVNIGVNILNIQKLESLYERIMALIDYLRAHKMSRKTPILELFKGLKETEWRGRQLSFNVSEVRAILKVLEGPCQPIGAFLKLFRKKSSPRLIHTEDLPLDEKTARLAQFYKFCPYEEARPLNEKTDEKEVVATHFNRTLFKRSALLEKNLSQVPLVDMDYPVRRLSKQQVAFLSKLLEVPETSRWRIYTGREVRHTPIMGYMTVDHPTDRRRIFKPYQSQQEELQIYFDQRKVEHFENWIELAAHVTCKTDRMHRFSADPNSFRLGDLIPAPDRYDGLQRWYVVTAATDNNHGNFNYILEPLSHQSRLPVVKLYRSTASDLHANNGLASLRADLTGQAPGDSQRGVTDHYEAPFFFKRTIPEEVSQWVAIQKRGALEGLLEHYIKLHAFELDKERREHFWVDLEEGRYENILDPSQIHEILTMYRGIADAFDEDALGQLWQVMLEGEGLVADSSKASWKHRMQLMTSVVRDLRQVYAHFYEKGAWKSLPKDLQKSIRADRQEFDHYCFTDLNIDSDEEHYLFKKMQALKREANFLRDLFFSLGEACEEMPWQKINQEILFAGHSLGGAQAQGGVWHFLFSKGRVPLPGCYVYCYANDAPKVSRHDNQGFMSHGRALESTLVANGNRFFIYHKEDGRGDPVPESGDQHLGTCPSGGREYRNWLKVVINVFRELPTTTLPEITMCSAHEGRTGKAIAHLRPQGPESPILPDVVYTALSQEDLWRFGQSVILPRDLRAVFDYRLFLSPLMTEKVRRSLIGRVVYLGVRALEWWRPELRRGHRDAAGAMHIGLGKEQYTTYDKEPPSLRRRSSLAVSLAVQTLLRRGSLADEDILSNSDGSESPRSNN